MRGTRKKQLCPRGMSAMGRRAVKRVFYAERARRVGVSRDSGTRAPWPGNVAPRDFHGRFRAGHVTRVIFPYFGELSPTGVNKALNLRFGTERKHGSPESLRRWPRGRPGQGSASRLPKPEILRRIAGLQQYRNVNQTARFG